VKVFRKPKYILVTILVALTVIAFAAWLPNLHLITKAMTSKTMTLWQKTDLVTSLLGSLQTNFTPLSRTIGFSSATTILGILPFRGQEFGFVGITILLLAISFTLKKINQPFVCKVKEEK